VNDGLRKYNYQKSAEHLVRAERLIPGGAHTYSRGADQYPEGMAPFVVSGSGCRVIDVDGNELIEYGMGLRSVALGHAFEPVDSAVCEQVSRGINFVRPHTLELTVAEQLAELIPCAEMVKFGVNGSDATNAAIRLARAYTGRTLVARCTDQPFFSTGDWFIGSTAMDGGIPASIKSEVYGFPYNDLAALGTLFDAHAGQFAAIIMEAETATPPAAGYFDGVRALCDRHGVVFILDEIITGFRWSPNGAQSVYGVRPDLSTFAKAMANGYPISALVGKRDIMRLGGFVEDADRVFLLSQTYGGSPLALVAAQATISHFRDHGAAEQLRVIGNQLRASLDQVIGEAGLGDFVSVIGPPQNLIFATRDADLQPSQAFRTLLLQSLLDHGIVAPSLVVSTAHDDAAINQTAEAFRSAMPLYAGALENGTSEYVRGRPVRPALRSRG
jgi:glutamate-1-semialdehyde 2,1-aminomutase